MSEQTKHEHFISKETLEQIANLVELLSNCFEMPMILFDAEGNIFCQSTRPSPCSDCDQRCYERLRDQLRDIYDTPVIEKCNAGVEIIAFPIKTETFNRTRCGIETFIGMLCLNPAFNRTSVELKRMPNMIALLDTLLRQIANRNQDLGELVAQLLEFQNELTLSYRFSNFSNAASSDVDIALLFQEALALIQSHIQPKEAYIILEAGYWMLDAGLSSIKYRASSIEHPASSIQHLASSIEKALQGIPVVINSYEGHPSTKSMLAMPIRTGRDVFGAVVLIDKTNGEMFLADDENFVASLTNSLGMVLKHVRLAQEVINTEKASVEKQKEIVARVVHKMRNLFVAMMGNVRWIHEITEDMRHETRDMRVSSLKSQVSSLESEVPSLKSQVSSLESEVPSLKSFADLKSALAGIDRNLQDSSKVISGFLKYVAPEQFQPEYTDMPSLISEIADDMRKALHGDTRIEEKYAQGLPQIQVDAELFRSIIKELIVNASQSLNGRGCIRLRTDFASDAEVEAAGAPANGEYIVIEVSDNGPGIPDDIKSKIFNLGFSTRSMGTGLGLSLVKRDVERHGGRIVEIGKEGADFLIVLPVTENSL